MADNEAFRCWPALEGWVAREAALPPRDLQPITPRAAGASAIRFVKIFRAYGILGPSYVQPRRQAFLLDADVPAGIEVAALWLRLRRAVIGRKDSPHRNHSFVSERRTGSVEKSEEDMEGGEGGGGDLGLGGAVDLSSVGEGAFKERDPEGSGVVSCDVFREVCSN